MLRAILTVCLMVCAMAIAEPTLAAQSGQTVHVSVWGQPFDPKAEGKECTFRYPEDLEDDTTPYDQLVVSSANGEILAVMPLGVEGKVEVVESSSADPEFQMRCVVRGDISIPDSTFYTFAMGPTFRYTVSLEWLQGKGMDISLPNRSEAI